MAAEVQTHNVFHIRELVQPMTLQTHQINISDVELVFAATKIKAVCSALQSSEFS